MSETISVHNMFSLGLNLEFSCIELVIQYRGLVDAKIRASDKDLPVTNLFRHLHEKVIIVMNAILKRL